MLSAEEAFREERDAISDCLVDGKWQIENVKQRIKDADPDTALKRFLLASMNVANADGGTIYMLDGKHLHIQLLMNRQLNIQLRSNPAEKGRLIPLYDKVSGKTNTHYVSVKSVVEKRPINIPNIAKTNDYEMSGSFHFDKIRGYITKSVLTIPIVSQQKAVGVLQLVNALDADSETVIPFSPDVESQLVALSSAGFDALTILCHQRRYPVRNRVINLTLLLLFLGFVLYFLKDYLLAFFK